MSKLDLLKYIDCFQKLRIGVLGDVMLDKYIWGSTNRISQEAPVPVVQVRRESSVPGGAANVARNILSLGGKSLVFGITGKDTDGDTLRTSLSDAGADISGLLFTPGRHTTVKTRVLAGNQQVVRIDHEDTSPVSGALRQKLRRQVRHCLESGELDALILEDYAKGIMGKDFMQGIVEDARRAGVITTLDPHPANKLNVKGLTLMTPNRKEAFELAGVKYTRGGGNPLEDRDLSKVAAVIFRRWNPEYLLVTLGADGMALFTRESPVPGHIPTNAKQVFDVSGAGDTVMASMVLAMKAGASPMDAAKIANYAAGVVVGMVGTAAIQADVLRETIKNS